MSMASARRYDVAIVGGGVAGCYCGYRLSTAFPDWRIALFESAPRLGGRLESKFMPGIDFPVELGGAFVSDLHEVTFALLHRLGLALEPVNWGRRFSFIRGRRLTDRTYRHKADLVPYAFSAAERGQTPSSILRDALKTIVPDFASLWPLDRESSPAQAARHLRALCFNGRLLDDWDIGALLREVVSSDAYESFLAGFGSAANFRNASAYDAIRTVMSEMAPQQPFVVAGGLQQLPLELARRSSAEIRMSTRLLRIRSGGGRVRMTFQCPDREEDVIADKVILALPLHALGLIQFDSVSADEVRAKLTNVTAVSACKLFFSFERPWWRARETSPGIGIAASYTDLPMQQCYYYDYCGKGPALLLAVFADEASASFWRPICANDDDATASAEMIEAALVQLRSMHPDADIPNPTGALARAWPAAWHVWRPGARSWQSAPAMLAPFIDLPVFVCGEAYSEQQGWAEGALSSAENLLREHFRLDPLL